MTINENIRELRLQKRLSQEGLGELLGVSAQAVSKWEQGVTSPDISLLPAMAECFGVTIDSLFQGVPVRKYPGYGGKRQELFAIYEHEGGTEEDFQRAAEAYRDIILSGKAVAQDYLSYGIMYKIRAARDIETALYYYRRAISEGKMQRDVWWMAAHQTLTNLLVDLGRADEAISEQRKWRDEDPDAAWAYVSYAYALERAGHLEEAWKEIETAIQIDSEDTNVLTAAGDLCAKMGRHEDAVKYWDRISKDSTSITHLFSKAEMFASIGNKEEAIKQYEEILIWLEKHGYNMELEGVYPRQRMEELRGQ